MRVSVALEHRFQRLPDGSVWTWNPPFGFWSWCRYLDVFDGVTVIARVRAVDQLDGTCVRADGPGVTFSALPYYVGPAQFLRQAGRIHRAVRQAVQPGHAFVLRVPGVAGDLVWRRLRALRYPYGVEALGDPYDVFAPGAVRHPLRGFFRWRGARHMRLECAEACAVSYVTQQALQDRYPATGLAASVSAVELPDELFAEQPRTFRPEDGRPARLVFVGSLEQYYKGPDVLIHAIARMARLGHNVELTMVGDGRLRPDLEALAARVGCQDRVSFAGHRGRAGVLAELDRADLFVLPSRTEGLPSAMLEAMTRGLPCIGGRTGGIPELLPADAMVPPGNARELADRIAQLIGDPARMARMSARNLEKAGEYRRDVLQRRRIGFYTHVREATEARLRGRPLRAPESLAMPSILDH